MLRQCFALAMLGTVLALPVAQYHQQQAEGIPPHLLRQYIGQQQLAQAQHQPQLLRPHAPAPAPAPVRLPYAVQSEDQYQQQPQPQQLHYRPQPQPQPQQVQYRPQPQPQLQQVQYRPQPQPQPQQVQYRPQPQYKQQESAGRDPQEDYDPNPSYQFGFDVNDDQFTNYQNRKEERSGDVIKGSYSVVDSDGFIRTVTYTADPKEGFKAEVSRTPTDIVVKIPTPKPQLQAQAQPQQIAHQPISQPRPQPPQYYRYEQ